MNKIFRKEEYKRRQGKETTYETKRAKIGMFCFDFRFQLRGLRPKHNNHVKYKWYKWYQHTN